MPQNLERKFFEKFSALLNRERIENQKFAVGVSGGADSLALIFLLKKFSEEQNIKFVALTVDHKLREDSAEEAKYVAKLMKQNSIEHHILIWEGEKPKTGIEEIARKIRYGLLQNFCEQNQVENLLIAHHKKDQAETFLMRLQRGSGVDGLSGIAEVSELGKLKLIRPLLDFMPEELKNYLGSNKIEWKEDYLNENEDFLRVRVRKFLPELEQKIGLTIDRLAKTSNILSRTRDYLEKQTDNFIKNNVKFYDEKALKISIHQLQNLHEEILFRTFAKLLKDIASRDYIPESEQVQRICDSLKNGAFKSRTLADCEIIFADKNIWIIPELKSKEIVEKKKLENFITEKYGKAKMPHHVKKYLFMKAIVF
ncbi:MAG: tRNA lysidine(34) synthetase TilS [Alphaproteobacteria bacterium]